MKRVLRPAALFAGFVVVAAAYAAFLGGFSQEYLSDAAIHFVTTALTSDYLRHGLHGSPLGFLDDYYRHYPLTGFGLWPPVYYGLSGLCAALFGTGRIATTLLSVAIAGASAAVVAVALWRRTGWPPAIFAGAIILLMPAQSGALRTLLIDPLNGLQCFVAAWLFARYLSDRTLRSALLFALAALLAIYTKGNGLLLALLPPFAIVLTGSWTALRDWRLYLAGAIVGLIALPWYLLTSGFTAQGFRYQWGLPFVIEAVPANLAFLTQNFGPLILLLAALGAWRVWRGRDDDPVWWRTMAALALACFVFQSIVPAALNLRYLFGAFLPIAAFAAAGLRDIARGGVRYAMIAGAIGAASMASVAVLGTHTPELSRIGARPAAVAALRESATGSPILVATSALAEAGIIAELAAADPARPSVYAVRGSKLLGGGGYFATDYVPRYATTAEAGAAIDRIGFPVIIVEQSSFADRWRHIVQIGELARAAPSRWRLAATVQGEGGRRFLVYRLTGSRHSPDMAAVRALNANPQISRFAE